MGCVNSNPNKSVMSEITEIERTAPPNNTPPPSPPMPPPSPPGLSKSIVSSNSNPKSVKRDIQQVPCLSLAHCSLYREE